ncbi:hypothetical protein DERF_004680 [Dermatophagoides farinae]|uniref:Uncharacterized protein n=1 Tax=Dermatophagoides farinae TaxID=6954 RepID=A0A922LAD3_DERFA|nr:hypothetical protein DERF_004680 [Dermatophagoides farinae]
MSALCSSIASMIFSHGVMTPRSITLKLLHAKTTPTIFLPMSCTSPFTVAITTVVTWSSPSQSSGLSSFSCSMNGIR